MPSIGRVDRVGRDGAERLPYRVRWRDHDGRQHAKSFARRGDADRFRTDVAADLQRGEYVDPDAGKVTFQSYATRWLAAQTFDPSTAEAVSIRLRLHAFPVLGGRPLNSVKPSTVQAWLRSLRDLAPSYRLVIFVNVSTVFAAAVDDGMLSKNPCRASSVSRPRVEARKLTPWTAQMVHDVVRQLPARYRIVAVLGAGLGLRQGEVFALSPDDVDWERGRVEVRRQVKLFSGNRQIFALPKARKTRTVPLPDAVREALGTHLAVFPARTVTLPWEHLDGVPRSTDLVVGNREGRATNRNYFNTHVWKPALERAGIEPLRENGCHALRHFYASTLLDAGENIKALSSYLGHADPGFTLRTYTHLMPASDARTKAAVDSAFRVPDVYQDAEGAASSQVSES